MKMMKEMIIYSIKNKINWFLLGKDKIINYWIKKMDIIDGDIIIVLNIIFIERLEILVWFMIGRSVMIWKRDDLFVFDY